MCGIAGKAFAPGAGTVPESMVRDMCSRIAHRGPDDEGVRCAGPVGLGMRRLKVIDLEGGHQPMSNEDGTVWVVFNGEIYNHVELRRDLEARGHRFNSRADTEVLVHLYEERGDDLVRELNGMFAFALVDERRQRLLMARDRLGQKPLYYAAAPDAVTFASELDALLCDGTVDTRLDPVAVDEYMRYLFVPHPRTVYRGVRKLPPGSRAVFEDGHLQVDRYWEVRYADRQASSIDGQVDALEEHLRESVRQRMLADVPLGAFLSGGLDSSVIAALMQQCSTRPVRTYAIGFGEETFSELAAARLVAEHLGTEHCEEVVDWDVEQLLPDLIRHFGEPFADSSAIPTYHLSRVARQDLTVALSGDGGDEIFGGYRRYQARRWARAYNRVPAALGRGAVDWLARRVREPATYYGGSTRKKIRRFLEYAAALRDDPHTTWAFFYTSSERRELYSEGFRAQLERETGPGSYDEYGRLQEHAADQAMLWYDLMTYLPDDILAKVDRASMACSLEVRSPFLDHRIVEFMAGQGMALKLAGGQTKVLLRRLGERLLPASVMERPKQGFAVPLAAWLQGPLRGWLERLVESGAIVHEYCRPEVVRRMVDCHVAGQRDLSQQLWSLVVLDQWLRTRRPT